MFKPLYSLALVCLLSSLVVAAEKKPDSEQRIFFERKIRPVLVKHCYSCHSAKAKTLQGGLRLDSRVGTLKGGDTGPAVVPGKPKQSLLLAALLYQDGLEMPPKGRLPANVVADFRRWIQMGAADPRTGQVAAKKKRTINYQNGLKFWAFQPPQDHKPPQVRDLTWPKRDLDRFVLARLEQAGLKPNAVTDRHTLIRRAYFNVIGLPPTPDQIKAFVQDPSPDAFKKVVTQLLASQHYGERWGRHWLDIARYGEDQAHTFKARRYPRGYRYRDWVVNALNNDMPYDQFVKAQIAGDLLSEETKRHQSVAALGLFALGPVYYQDNGEKAKALADEWDDRVDTLSRGLLGLTVSCARCHDHKYDPITMKDYYGLVGIFASSQYTERPVVAPAVVRKKQQLEADAKERQLQIDRFLAKESRNVRADLVEQIEEYVVAAWKVKQRQKRRRNNKRLFAQVAKQEKVSEYLLRRWVSKLDQVSRRTPQDRSWWAGWKQLIGKEDAKKSLVKNKAALARVQTFAKQLQRQVNSHIKRRAALFAQFGRDVAFASGKQRAVVKPGHIPLGNLFDDDKNSSLDAALASDPFKAVATAKSLGVDRVVYGWGNATRIAPGIRFDFQHLGSDKARYGNVTNDGWDVSGGISTRGRRTVPRGRQEQGIGMHANALITFDLDEIRKAGLMPPDQKFVLRVDRAGINDDAFGSSARLHLAVVVAARQKKNEVFDSIIAGYVNGKRVSVTENDRTYYFNGQIPDPLTSNGKFVKFEVPVPAHAKYLTIVSAAARKDGEANSINSDHGVFSGARLVQDPISKQALAKARKRSRKLQQNVNAGDRLAALMLSEFLADKGLLAVPGKDAAGLLKGQAKTAHQSLVKQLNQLKSQAKAIQVSQAHSLREGNGRDLNVYLKGNPTKLGEKAPRGMLPILTKGQRRPFQSKGSGRKELALAVADKNNPLTARVIVNRVWRGHFGFGLVRTPSNFGALGERPTHPRLLDYLVHRFIESGWSLKWLHREIMLSQTFQMSSRQNEKNYNIDGDNRLLWRMNRRRLEVEPWRDAMLKVAGRLDTKSGGPSANLNDANNRRRTLYGFVSRHRLDDLLRLFDFPDPNITSAKRTVTTVPLQQLFVLNSKFMMVQAKALARRLQEKKAESNEERIRRAYLLLYGRQASSEEVEIGAKYLQLAGSRDNKDKSDKLSAWEQYTLALLGANEFTYID